MASSLSDDIVTTVKDVPAIQWHLWSKRPFVTPHFLNVLSLEKVISHEKKTLESIRQKSPDLPLKRLSEILWFTPGLDVPAEFIDMLDDYQQLRDYPFTALDRDTFESWIAQYPLTVEEPSWKAVYGKESFLYDDLFTSDVLSLINQIFYFHTSSKKICKRLYIFLLRLNNRLLPNEDDPCVKRVPKIQWKLWFDQGIVTKNMCLYISQYFKVPLQEPDELFLSTLEANPTLGMVATILQEEFAFTPEQVRPLLVYRRPPYIFIEDVPGTVVRGWNLGYHPEDIFEQVRIDMDLGPAAKNRTSVYDFYRHLPLGRDLLYFVEALYPYHLGLANIIYQWMYLPRNEYQELAVRLKIKPNKVRPFVLGDLTEDSFAAIDLFMGMISLKARDYFMGELSLSVRRVGSYWSDFIKEHSPNERIDCFANLLTGGCFSKLDHQLSKALHAAIFSDETPYPGACHMRIPTRLIPDTVTASWSIDILSISHLIKDMKAFQKVVPQTLSVALKLIESTLGRDVYLDEIISRMDSNKWPILTKKMKEYWLERPFFNFDRIEDMVVFESNIHRPPFLSDIKRSSLQKISDTHNFSAQELSEICHTFYPHCNSLHATLYSIFAYHTRIVHNDLSVFVDAMEKCKDERLRWLKDFLQHIVELHQPSPPTSPSKRLQHPISSSSSSSSSSKKQKSTPLPVIDLTKDDEEGSSSSSSSSTTAPIACVVCFDGELEATFKCGHFCCCVACANQIIKSSISRCPMCRTPVKKFIRIFKS